MCSNSELFVMPEQMHAADIVGSVRIPATLSAVRLLCDVVTDAAMQLCDDAEFSALLEIAAAEAANNIVIHGYCDNPGGWIHLEIKSTPNYVCLILNDGAPYFDPLANSPAEDTPVACTSATDSSMGMGVFIFKDAMDCIRYRMLDKGNQLLMYKLIPNKTVKEVMA